MERNEEQLLLEALLSANIEAQEAHNTLVDAKTKDALAKARQADARQAVVGYMMGNGVVETEHFKVTTVKTKSVDVENLDSVPESYIRIKKELNKAKIEADKLPESNWLKYSEKETIRLEVK